MILYSLPVEFVLECKMTFAPQNFDFWFEEVFCYVEVKVNNPDDEDTFLFYDNRFWMVGVHSRYMVNPADSRSAKEPIADTYFVMSLCGLAKKEYSVDKLEEMFRNIPTAVESSAGVITFI